MSPLAVTAATACASILGGTATALAVVARSQRRQRAHRRSRMLDAAGSPSRHAENRDDAPLLRYMEQLTRRLYIGSTTALSPGVRSGRAADSRPGAWYLRHRAMAGLSKSVSTAAFCEARLRLMLGGALAGILLGLMLSLGFAVVLGLAFGLVGARLPRSAVMTAIRKRSLAVQRHLSEMLEIVALGLRSGLAFDRSFALYGAYFDNVLARACTKAYRSWTLGLASREEALDELAASFDAPQLSRVMESMVRSLRFGSPLAGILDEAATQSRESCRALLEERVAKAPVKMMLPTGTLILPAMLLLILGPVLLELAGGF